MRTLLFIFGFLIPWASSAVVFQSSQVNQKSYEQYLHDHRKESAVSYFQKTINEGNSFNENLIESSDLTNPESTLLLLGTAERPAVTLYTLEFLKNLAERSLEFKKSKAAIELLCFSAVLSESNTAQCDAKEFPLAVLKEKAPDYNFLMVEGVAFHIQTLKSVRLIPKQLYHFTLLSNSRMPFRFAGTWEAFIQQTASQDFWVQGDCDRFHTRIEDMSLRLQSEVMFKNCSLPIQQAEESKPAQTWMQRNKKWVYLSGALLVGAGIYAMKDKKIVIDRSGF